MILSVYRKVTPNKNWRSAQAFGASSGPGGGGEGRNTETSPVISHPRVLGPFPSLLSLSSLLPSGLPHQTGDYLRKGSQDTTTCCTIIFLYLYLEMITL